MKSGDKIKKYRELCNLTQQELADYSDINVATIKKYELGQRNPKPDQLEKIAKGLGFNPIIFYDLDLSTVGDVMSLLFLISDVTKIEFKGKNEKGEYLPDDLMLQFSDFQLSYRLSNWAELLSVLDGLKNDEIIKNNDDVKDVVYSRINEMETDFRLNAMEDNSVLLDKDTGQHPNRLDLPYITMKDAEEAERLGMPLVDYLISGGGNSDISNESASKKVK